MAIIPLPLKADFRAIAGKATGKVGDPKAAARSRRYRHRKRDARSNAVTPETVTPSVTVDTVTMVQLAARIGAGRATAADLELAERLLLALAAMLAEDGAIGLPDSPRSQ